MTVYLTVDDEGNFGETEDIDEADWFRLDDEGIDFDLWSIVLDEEGEPIINTVITQEQEDAYTVYFVLDGEPTRDLTDANWTPEADKPEGWTFVDERSVTVKDGVEASTEKVEIAGKDWTEQKFVPATYGPCAPKQLPRTGSNALVMGGLAALLLAAGGGVVFIARRHTATNN